MDHVFYCKIMKQFNKHLLFTMIVLISSISASAGAQSFGVKEGASIASLVLHKEAKLPVYYIDPPEPHPDFFSYRVKATPENGVCDVEGIGKPFLNDADGSLARNSFKRIRDQLTVKYGKSELYDFLQSGSIWREPLEWATSLDKNQRSYNQFWTKEHKSNLPNSITNIHLGISAIDSSTTYIFLYYQFKNFENCEKSATAGGSAL